MSSSQHSIISGGVGINVETSGNAGGETIILVHGFPDDLHVWDMIVPMLEPSYHVVRYDVRGAGSSEAPATRSGYMVARLIDDLVAVIDHVRPDGAAVHLVGHDWGSVQLWGAVMREAVDRRLTGRIVSYTSISGPGLDLFGHFIATSAKQREIRSLVTQIAHSWYVGVFRLPIVPELIFGHFGSLLRKRLSASQRPGDDDHWSESFAADGARGVNLYRANRLSFAKGTTSVPVQLIVPVRDAFLTPALYADIEQFAPNLTRINIEAGHWVQRTHPEVIADRIAVLVEAHADKPATG